MKKNVLISLGTICIIAFFIWIFHTFVQPILPSQVNGNIFIIASIIIGVVTVLSGLKDIIELLEKLGQKNKNIKNKEEPTVEIPNQSYEVFFGREQKVTEIMNSLRNPDGIPLIGIDGIGGIGKTALAHEIINRALEEKLFRSVVWEQPRLISNPWSLENEDAENRLSEILDSLARKLGLTEVQSLDIKLKKRRLQKRLNEEIVLVIIDNLETFAIDQTAIINNLLPLLGKSKAILTSRHRFQKNVYPIHLTGLNKEDAIKLVMNEISIKGILEIDLSDYSIGEQISNASGGSPLAIKLVVGQLTTLPLEVVISKLERIHFDNKINEDEYLIFYREIFFPTWYLLNPDSQKLLIAMSNFVPGVGGTYPAIKCVSDLEGERLINSVNQLWKYSMIEISGPPNILSRRYYLHTLTHNFVVSDIVNKIKTQ